MTALFMGIPAHLFRRADGKPVEISGMKSLIPKLEEVKPEQVVLPAYNPTSSPAYRGSAIAATPASSAPQAAPTGTVRGFAYSETHARSGSESDRLFPNRFMWPCSEDGFID